MSDQKHASQQPPLLLGDNPPSRFDLIILDDNEDHPYFYHDQRLSTVPFKLARVSILGWAPLHRDCITVVAFTAYSIRAGLFCILFLLFVFSRFPLYKYWSGLCVILLI